jgi:hypothetical protein
MTRSYGKTHRPARQQPIAPPAEIQINITGRHTLEQLSLEVQRAIERLNVHGVAGVEKFRIRLLPLDDAGAPVAVWDDHGQQVLTINIPDLPPEKPYRDNEPGVGVSPAEPGPGSRRKSAPRL